MSEPGTQIGAYTVESEIGRGGMGVVYKGTDSRLGRTVAIKALPEHFAQVPERLARFEREARTLATLSHPNVAGIYGVEEHDGGRYLILEYVEGVTLGERLDSGPLSVDDALEICSQIAAGVEAAHEAGVIHRDLKPANIKITPEGQAKVLDFGLARTEETSSSGSSISQLPTMASPAGAGSPTMPGAVLGTAPYMSPEQARGRRVDKRADIWSLGVVLYECLTGASPFVGETTSDSIGAILHKDVDLESLPAGTPHRLRQLLERMLTKNKAHRMRDAGDVWIELEAARKDLAQGVVEDVARVTGPTSIARTLTFAAVLVIAIIATAVATNALSGARSPTGQTTFGNAVNVSRLSRLTTLDGSQYSPVLTPDGNSLLFASESGDGLDIFSVRVGGLNTQNLTPNTPGNDMHPAISPDGQRVAFNSERGGGGIWVMGATGESPRRLTDFGANASWSPDGARIVFATESILNPFGRSIVSELWVVDADGGEPVRLYAGDAVQPNWSPNGHRIAFWGLMGGGQRDLFTISADGDDLVSVTSDAATDWSPEWSPDGKWLYFSSDRNGAMNVWRMPMDETTGQPTGEAQPITIGDANANTPSLNASGNRIAVSLARNRVNVLRLDLDEDGDALGEPSLVLGGAQNVGAMHVSPDGRRIVATIENVNEDIAVFDIDGANMRLLMRDEPKDRGPVWSADGETILFYSDRSGAYQIWEIRADGSGLKRVSDLPGSLIYFPTYAPDDSGDFYYHGMDGLYRTSRDDDGIAREPGDAILPPQGWLLSLRNWSPDGQFLAGSSSIFYEAIQSDTVYYSLIDDSWHVALKGGADADWLNDTTLIAARDRDIVRVDLETGESRVIYTTSANYSVGFIEIDRRTNALYFTRNLSEADIWLLELEQRE